MAGCDRAHEPAADGSAADVAAAPGPLAQCGLEGDPQLTGEGFGAARLGATVEQVTLACHVIADTINPLGPEGQAERSLILLMGAGPDTLRAVVMGDSIWRLHITSEWPRTEESLGVGSTVRDLRTRRDAQLIRGEGRLFVTTADPCGLSFRLDRADDAAGLTLAALPDTVRVTEVLVVGCR